jgi:hypothetical protein
MHSTRMDEGTDEDFQILKRVHERTLQELPDRLFGLLDGPVTPQGREWYLQRGEET